MVEFVKAERLWLKAHPQLSEKWVQALIAADPAILGLGDLVLRGQERTQPRAGRLDLLLQDPDSQRRDEVELQLGATDESHIGQLNIGTSSVADSLNTINVPF